MTLFTTHLFSGAPAGDVALHVGLAGQSQALRQRQQTLAHPLL